VAQLFSLGHIRVMLTITFQILELVSFVALLVLFLRVSGWPNWRIRVIIYGWALVFVYTLFWAAILPMSLRGIMDSHELVAAFPDGTIAAAALFGGWFWPMIVVVIRNYRDHKRIGDDHVA
jgi:hypothetical protein